MATQSITVSNPVVLAGKAPDDTERTAHHVKAKNGDIVRFRNPFPSLGEVAGLNAFQFGFRFFRARMTGEMVFPDTTGVSIPIVKPTFPDSCPPAALRATWLGHACYLVEFPSGLRVLFDPVFEDRCSPSQLFGPRRYTPPPCAIADLPPLHAVVISHSHYDHLSHPTVVELAALHPAARFFVGLGLASWFRASGIDRVTEMDWWEDAELTVTTATENNKEANTATAQISCLPSQHASQRHHGDKDATLWASWAVSSGGRSAWFAGDTGYRAVPTSDRSADDYGPAYEALPRCPAFRRIGELRGPFDLGLIPIGAYAPRRLMSPVHANPYDAVEIFKDTRCRRAMGIHWGTWLLTTEEAEEPPRLLKEALAKSRIAEKGVFDVCAVGETREF